ncbi:acyl-CoA dehydrogenase family protein [Microbacterium thalassium]|uniref:Putative acyl-CoA dehydrogenase n=1 Tax=Microbacterium thalassium TaxID=362649 RepID=A0A7X0KUW7_9MICO|nr:acyl-CoA dehydrogenase family protein [Microbacterium thalassium]MBB6391605.1 putative acyl-CoA dehydrogenase [Microbacterium thalassium]GLK24208.1 acyl-CoA dehydrogenase [Microbacterium thalassium]
MDTHTVVNQPPPRVDVDEYGTNAALVEGVERYDAAWAHHHLHLTGQRVGTASFIADAATANRREPTLRTHDRYGHRIDEVEYDDSYHRIISAAIGDGAHTSAWADPRPGANVARAAAFMLYAQVEPGHACPVSMTHSVVPVLQAHPGVGAPWLDRVFSRTYDGHLRPGKPGAVFGMAMTEKQGGSDVRANMTSARPIGDGRYVLDGHKWFCSAPMSDAFLVLAQAPGGLSCFLVPRLLEDGERNGIRIMRLKDKLGNRANASSEVEYDGAVGTLVGEEGRGVRTIIEMVARTRLDCTYGSTAGMRQATAEAAWHARHRSAFGRLLVDQPAMQGVLADLQLETEAATAVSLRLARAHDADADAGEIAFRRLATAVTKYWVCKRGPGHAYEALECLGGNGYTEDFPLAMRYREQPVLAVWEGSGNVIALDVLRALSREPETWEAFDAELALASGVDARFDAHLGDVRRLVAEVRADAAPGHQARGLVSALAVALQASLLLRTAPPPVADAFVASRLGDRRFGGALYGALPDGVDVRAIVERI